MLGPECWSIRVACSPGVNCLEDLILTFAFFYDVSQETSFYLCIPLLWEAGGSGSPTSVLPEPYQKMHCLTLFHPFQRRSIQGHLNPKGLGATASQLSPDPSKVSGSFRIQHAYSNYSFHHTNQTLGHRSFQAKSRFCVLTEGRYRAGWPTPAIPSPVLQLPGSWSWSWASSDWRSQNTQRGE